MSLEVAITALAQAIQFHGQMTVEAAKIYAAANGVPTNVVSTPVVNEVAETAPAEEPAPAPAKKKSPAKKVIETPAEPDPEKEVVKEEDVEEPRKPAKEEKPAVDVEKVKDEIRAVFQQLAEFRSDLPIAVLKEQGQQRLSTVPADELPAVLLAARDKLKSVQQQETYE